MINLIRGPASVKSKHPRRTPKKLLESPQNLDRRLMEAFNPKTFDVGLQNQEIESFPKVLGACAAHAMRRSPVLLGREDGGSMCPFTGLYRV